MCYYLAVGSDLLIDVNTPGCYTNIFDVRVFITIYINGDVICLTCQVINIGDTLLIYINLSCIFINSYRDMMPLIRMIIVDI